MSTALLNTPIWSGKCRLAEKSPTTSSYSPTILRLSRTPITVPWPDGVGAYLTQHFEGRVADFLAVRLVKGTDWEEWRVAGVLYYYLKEQARPSTTEPVLRFAVETKNDEWRGWAIETIQASRDPDLKNKLDVERRRTQALAIPFPAALAALTPAKAP